MAPQRRPRTSTACGSHSGELPSDAGARPVFDGLIAHTPTADGVDHEPDEIGGIPSWRRRPTIGARRAQSSIIMARPM
jgi:hypothetical protein